MSELSEIEAALTSDDEVVSDKPEGVTAIFESGISEEDIKNLTRVILMLKGVYCAELKRGNAGDRIIKKAVRRDILKELSDLIK